MSFGKKVYRILDERLENWMITVFYTYFIVIIVLEVTLRYGFNKSTIIGEETARHAFIWLSWIAASVAVKKRIHIKIAYLENKVSRLNQFKLNFLYNGLFILFCIISIGYVWPTMQTQVEYGTLSRAAQYPMWIPYLAVPFGYGMMIFRTVQNILVDITDMKAGRPIQTGEALF
jgi:TRAP-type C4-dicarboxylate transport system permease small subunit